MLTKKINSRIEKELIFGALDRERRWRNIAYITTIFGIISCLIASITAISLKTPAPELVPFDIRSGVLFPNVKITSLQMQHTDAIVESLIYSYVMDRETYHFFDNDLRIEAVKNRSASDALKSLISLWNDGPGSLTQQYGENGCIDTVISSITLLSQNRAQIQIRKRLTFANTVTDGSFLITMEYLFNPKQYTSLENLWKNPFGFTVKQYRIVAQQYMQD